MIDDVEIEKRNFQRIKYLSFLKHVDVDNILISSKDFSGEKSYRYFTGYTDGDFDDDYDDYKIKPFCIMLQQTCLHVKSYDDKTKRMHFLIEDDELLKIYNNTWNKVNNNIKEGFDSGPTCNKIFMETKIKSYKRNITSDFYDKKIPEEGFNYICLSIILNDSVSL